MRLFIERLISLIVILFGVVVVTFFVSRVIPADPAHLAAGVDAPPAQVEAMRKSLGLDKPIPVQFWIYVKGLLHGDLGRSLQTRRPVLEDLKLYFPATLELALLATFFYVLIGIPLGVLAAVNFGRLPDYAIRFVTVTGLGIPAFALALALQLLFAHKLGWFPLEGRLDASISPPHYVTGLYTIDSLLARNWVALRSSLDHLVLPVTALALGRLAVATRFTRNSLLEVLRADYIRVARAKGLHERTIIYRHALRNALIPVVTIIGIQTGYLLGGTVLVEVVFTWPGLGRYAVASIFNFDFYSVIGVTLVVATMFVLTNFIVDLLYRWIDPRIHL
ncbi:MAG: ABC transporter permease [Ardenticatenaceae bacterium]|nr:ABC transporter permease [Ardenticatenaceae bacterium]HBY98639.1 peptide ABC transporter permease [Chloroflexota bacterium]